MLFTAMMPSVLGQQSQNNHINESILNEEWRWVQFTTQSGLPSNHVTALVESKDGIIWVATTSGIAWFDGFRWNVIDSSMGAPTSGIYLMSIDTNNFVGLTTRNKKFFQGNTDGFHEIKIPSVVSEAIARENKILVRNSTELSEYDGKDFHLFAALPKGAEEKFEGQGLWVTKSGNVWINTRQGLYRREGREWQMKIPASWRDCIVNSLIEDKSGQGLSSIGMPFDRRGLWEWSNHSMPKVNKTTRGDWVKSMDINEDGDVVAIDQSEEVLLRCDGRWSKLSTIPAQLRDVDFVRFRTNGDLWAGSEKGLFLFKHHSLRWEYKRNKFPNRNRIHEIIQSVDGSLWLGTADGLEIHYPNGKVKIITHIGGKPLYEITGIAEDSYGHIWISSGSAFDGTYRWDGDRWEYFRVDKNIKWLKFHKIRKDRQGRLWFLGLSKNTEIDGLDAPGAYEYVNDAFRRWSTKDGLVSGRVYSFGESSDGALWFGTQHALSRWKDGNWKHWYLQGDIPFARIFTLAIDDDNKVWFSDNHNGLGSIDKEGNLKIITTSDGLLNNCIWDLAVDSGGRLWMTTEGGVSCLEHGEWKNFDAQSGLLTNDLWPILPIGDSVYVGTKGKGLAILNLRRSQLPPPKIFYNKPVIEGNNAFIRFFPYEYAGDLQPSSILVRYSVNNAGWSKWDTRHDIVLSNLKPDDYSLSIQAQNLFGEFSPEGTMVDFTISPPFYRQPIFFLPVGSLFLIMTLILIGYIRHKKKYNREIQISEAKFRHLTESTFEGIVIHNAGVVKEANQNMIVMFGYSSSELKGKLLLDLIVPEGREIVMKNIETGHEKPFEAIGVRKDSSKIWLEVILTSIQGGRDHSSVAAIRDISDRKQTEKQLLTYQTRLRSLASELSITEERERRQMAAFLHDSIGQLLAFCKIKLGSLQKSAACTGNENHIQEIRDLVDEAIQNTRSLTLDLSPPILYELGFEAAVKSLAEKMSIQHGIDFIVKTDKASKPLNIENKVLLYLAVKELLTNIIKHAQAHQVIISITKQKDSIKIEISDDGIGFDSLIHTSKGIQSGGFGLFNIRENLFHLGGHMEIHSRLGHGTQVNIIVKLQNTITSTGMKYEYPDSNS